MVLISYTLTRQSPLYKNSLPVSIQPIKSTNKGDNTNSSSVSFSNHSGTHIDLPLHFCHNAESVADLLMPETFFYPAYCLDISRTGLSPITTDDFRNRLADITDAEALLVRTGMSSYRNIDQYTSKYPWVDPEVPEYLRKYLPRLRLFGTDTLSVSNPAFRDEGRRCHRNFLCDKPEIMILEDLNLSHEHLSGHPWLLRLYPWIIDTFDAVPVVALLEEKTLEK